MPTPPIPFSSTNNVSDLVQFTSALRDAESSLRLACDDSHPLSWTKGWDKNMQRHVPRAVRATAPQVSPLKSMVSDAFAQGGRLQDCGRTGPHVLQHIVRTLCRPLSTATPARVMQALQNLVVPAKTPFGTYLSEMRLLLQNVCCVRSVAAVDGTMQIAIKTGVYDQFAGLSTQIFAGRNLRTLPFDSIDGIMRFWEDLVVNQTGSTAWVRLSGGGATQNNSRGYNKVSRSRQYGGFMSVEQKPFEDE